MRKIVSLNGNAIPPLLSELETPPKQLFIEGNLDEILARPRVVIVGSRKVTAYGRTMTEQLSGELAKQGVAIVSGLALGIDSIAHQAALDAGGVTLAVLPSSLEKIYPSSHRQLARDIVAQGGALMSEYPPGSTIAFKGNFIARNRLVSGISDAVLIPEASLGSGTLHTAGFAKEQGKVLLAVPGNVTSPNSRGTNMLIQRGALAVTSAKDVLDALGLKPRTARKPQKPTSQNPNEQAIIDLIYKGMSDGAELLHASRLDARLFSQTLTMLEITGVIKSAGNNKWALTS